MFDYQPWNMWSIKRDINQQDFTIVHLHFFKSDDFYPFEVVNRVSDAQLQVGENSN